MFLKVLNLIDLRNDFFEFIQNLICFELYTYKKHTKKAGFVNLN